MLFKTPLAFAVVAAISASLMALVGGLFALGIHLGLVHFAVIRAVSYFKLVGLVVFVAVVFVLTLPIETVYARRTLFSENRSSNAMLGFLLFPVAVAVFLWRLCKRLL
jgi:hypothetical protein